MNSSVGGVNGYGKEAAMLLRIVKWIGWLALFAGAAWSIAALNFCLPGWAMPGLAASLAVVLYLALLLAARTGRQRAAAWAVLLGLILAWYLMLTPKQDADWSDDVARLPHAEINGDTITMHDVRDFNYRSETEYDIRYYDRTYDLSQLQSLDLFLSYWDSPHIAHTILSFGFSDASRLAFSIETRKQRGEQYSAVRGFFRIFELIYVAADERDIVRLRTNYRKEQVYLYRLQVPPEQMRRLLLVYLGRMNSLYRRPEFYNALTSNCTTNIFFDIKSVNPLARFNWRMLANGHLDELIYRRRRIDTSLAFEEVRRRAYINPRAEAADQDPLFSARIRG